MAKEISENTSVGIDTSGDGKANFSINIKTIISVVVILFSSFGFYYKVMSDIEEAKALPKAGQGLYVVDPGDLSASNSWPPARGEYKMKDEMSRAQILQIQKEIEELKEEIKELRKKVYGQ